MGKGSDDVLKLDVGGGDGLLKKWLNVPQQVSWGYEWEYAHN